MVSDEAHNKAEYDLLFGPKFGLPEVSIPMGFSGAGGETQKEMPLGLSVFADFGQDETLMKIAYAYEQQAGSAVRRTPDSTPALEDEALNAFLLELIDRTYAVDLSKVGKKCEGKAQVMLAACEKAKAVDTKDPYATYEAARALAEAYDRVKEAL